MKWTVEHNDTVSAMQATVDMADLVGIYLVMSRVSGKGSVKVLIAGLGWAFAELVLTRLVQPLIS